jgi:thiamine biosynthesis protein ThiS
MWCEYDYVIAGHVYATTSKPGGKPLGLSGFQEIALVSSVPVIAIGGIAAERVAEVLAVGATGIAVMSGINDREDPERAAAAYRRALEAFPMTNLKSDQIEVTINGKPAFVSDGISVADYLKQRNHHQRMVVVELNGSIIRKESFESASIHAGDKLEIVHFVGGG